MYLIKKLAIYWIIVVFIYQLAGLHEYIMRGNFSNSYVFYIFGWIAIAFKKSSIHFIVSILLGGGLYLFKLRSNYFLLLNVILIILFHEWYCYYTNKERISVAIVSHYWVLTNGYKFLVREFMEEFTFTLYITINIVMCYKISKQFQQLVISKFNKQSI